MADPQRRCVNLGHTGGAPSIIGVGPRVKQHGRDSGCRSGSTRPGQWVPLFPHRRPIFCVSMPSPIIITRESEGHQSTKSPDATMTECSGTLHHRRCPRYPQPSDYHARIGGGNGESTRMQARMSSSGVREPPCRTSGTATRAAISCKRWILILGVPL